MKSAGIYEQSLEDPSSSWWQIKTDDNTGYDKAALQIIKNGKVLAWLTLSPEQLDKLSKGASDIASYIRKLQRNKEQ